MKVALGIEYDGAAFFGWQRQREVDTVQEQLEKALSIVANHQVDVFCAGRTDAGVHGTGQVVHFNTVSERNERAWTLGVNANLPDSIAVKWAKEVPEDFHARFSATARRYRYIIYNSKLRPAILGHGLSHYHTPLDADRMHEAAQSLLGEQDFSSFRAAQCQSKSPNRFIHFIHVFRQNDFIIIDIKANAFVHHMVRNISGSLIDVGRGDKPVSWIKELLDAKDRTLAAETAKPNGLYLVDVDYPQEFALPKSAIGPLFLKS
jgi:tRNA pseudouridine38-40 synthase